MELDCDKKYVVACSFGPDSMALLNMMNEENYNFVVAHVNYHKRKESDFEEKSLKDYCKKNNLPCFILDTSKLKHSGNFQDWARRIRYEFFKTVINENQCDATVVAHQQDDLIETFLMQQNKGSFVSHFGIKKETTIFGVKIIRPLLNFSKKQLEEYDIKNSVPYSVDSSNLTNVYTRNKIRHEIVEKLSSNEREEILKNIRELNKQNKIENNLDLYRNNWELHDFLSTDNRILIMQISNNLQKRNIFKKLSIKMMESVKKSLLSDNSNILYKLIKNIVLVKSYNNVYLIDLDQFSNYEYYVKKPGNYSFEFVDFCFRENDHDRNISIDDFPVFIRPVSKDDFYTINDYNCKARRLFIDWKMPKFMRGWWPGIYNSKGQLLYIPRYRETYTDTRPTKFVIKLPQF